MSQAVLTVHHDVIEKMKAFYTDHLVNECPTGAIFRAKVNDCAITAYRSGKVLFQGKRALDEATIWEEWSKSLPTKPNQKNNKLEDHDFLPPENIGELAIIGSDEVGTGDYFGPIVVCAAFVDQEIKRNLPTGIRDSKTLTDAKIKELAAPLSKLVPNTILTLSNEKYNQLVEKGYTQTQMKAILHHQALSNVIKKLDGKTFDGCLIDQFTAPKQFFEATRKRPDPLPKPIFFKTKAESLHLSVATASVLARYVFLKALSQLSTEAGLDLPKGAGAVVDDAGAEIIRTKGESFLKKIAKVHFANTEKAKRLV
ncbi:ribonuclease HIII [Tuberibacillus calidus]|jgi:ribonuclease HIII|uniref:ribonuclease HIII n=1 Tax=Tuberibacillus calidus TaxID=340097 RepID=UPI0004860FA9|nr:ribonuclease HIII [Tuberibacillus calidus]